MSRKCSLAFFRIRNPKNSSHTDTLHNESRCVLIHLLQNISQNDTKASIEDDFVVLSLLKKRKGQDVLGPSYPKI